MPKLKIFKFYMLSFGFALCILSLTFTSYAKEVTLLYTGSTHAMLYPCSCPKEPDGGIARRATLIRELKKKYPQAVLLDAGNFFAGGLMDEYTQNTELDMQRSLINLKALELMGYDALNIGADEFNFSPAFFRNAVNKIKLTFLSSNLKGEGIAKYLIKEISGIKLGIVGLTNPAVTRKAVDLSVVDPKIAVAEAVSDLKRQGVNIVVVLSDLDDAQNLNLISSVRDINILITGRDSNREDPSYKIIGNILILKPAWQGRKLSRISFTAANNKISNFKVEDLRLSDKISDDRDILAILPRCFSDANCVKTGLVGRCQNAGTLNANCLFMEANKINLLVITRKECPACNTEAQVNFLKQKLPGLDVSYLYYPEKKAEGLVKELDIRALPAYLLSKDIEKEKNFSLLKDGLEPKGNFYMLKPQITGLAYFLRRKNIKGKLDLFMSLYDKGSPELLKAIKEFNPDIHFLAVESQDNTFDAKAGRLEVEEYLRAVCIQRHYPKQSFNYLACRAANINSSWWEDCTGDIDIGKIKSCARGSEGFLLLKENTSLNKELGVMFGPTYLVNNQEIFSSAGAPAKEELKKIIKR